MSSVGVALDWNHAVCGPRGRSQRRLFARAHFELLGDVSSDVIVAKTEEPILGLLVLESGLIESIHKRAHGSDELSNTRQDWRERVG